MVLKTRKKRRKNIKIEKRPLGEVKELVAFCPNCKVLETLLFIDDNLIQTRKFRQEGETVYHNCGAKEPCRLYRFS